MLGSIALDTAVLSARPNPLRSSLAIYSPASQKQILVNPRDFSSASWTKSNCTVVLVPGGGPLINGVRQDAWQFKESTDVGATVHQCYQNPGVIVGKDYEDSVYLKSNGTRTQAALNVPNLANAQIFFNLLTGAIVSSAGATDLIKVENAGDGWWRLSCHFLATLTTEGLSVLSAASGDWSVQGDGASGMLVALPQIERVPVWNLLKDSEDLSTGNWSTIAATVTANQGTAPDGTNTADRLQITAALSLLSQSFTSITGQYNFSAWVKSNTGASQTFRLRLSDGITPAFTVFTVGTTWTRLYISAPLAAATASIQIRSSDDATTADVLVWGAQVSLGASQLPYQKTPISSASPSPWEDWDGATLLAEQSKAMGWPTAAVEYLDPNSCPNSDFATDTLWNKGTGWSISAGKGVANNASQTIYLSQTDCPVQAGVTYEYSYTISDYSAGNIRVALGASGADEWEDLGHTVRSANGTYTARMTPATTGAVGINFLCNTFTGKLDNISLRAVVRATPDRMSGAGLVGNLLAKSEPLLADLSQKSAAITQAAFTENGLTNGAGFPAAAQSDYALYSLAGTIGVTYTLTLYVVMNDSSAPVAGASSGDFSLDLENVKTAGTVTQVSGSLYQVKASRTATGASPLWGLERTGSYSGKAFRVTGFSLTTTPGPYVRTGPLAIPMHPNQVENGNLKWPPLLYGAASAAPAREGEQNQSGIKFTTDDYLLSPVFPLKEARRNLLAYGSTEDLTNAAWVNLANATRTADTITVTVSGNNNLRQAVTVVPGQVYAWTFEAKAGTLSNPKYWVYDGTHSAQILAQTDYSSLINGSTWTPLTVTFVAPAGCVLVYIYPTSDSVGTGTVQVRKFQVEPVTPSMMTLGNELVTNGGFDTDSVWVKSTGWTIANGVLNQSGAGSDVVYEPATSVAGHLYRFSFSVSAYVSGGVLVSIGGYANSTPDTRANGNYLNYVVGGNDGWLRISCSGSGGFTGSVDNVSVKEVTAITPTSYQNPDLLPVLNMAGDWGMLLVGKFDGTTGSIAGIADPTSASKWHLLSQSSQGAGKIAISSYDGAENLSAPLSGLSTTQPIVLLFVNRAGTLTLTNLATGASTSVTAKNLPGLSRFGFGCAPRSTPGFISDSMHLAYFVPWINRAPSVREGLWLYKYLQRSQAVPDAGGIQL